MKIWYLTINGQNVGPLSVEELKVYNPTKDSLVWKEGEEEWKPLFTYPELMMAIHKDAPAGHSNAHNSHPSMPPGPTYSEPDKTKTTFGLLAIIPSLFGICGIEYFYINKPLLACLLLIGNWVLAGAIGVITFFTLGFGAILFPVCLLPALFCIIQGIIVLCGTQEKFEEKFVNTSNSFPLF